MLCVRLSVCMYIGVCMCVCVGRTHWNYVYLHTYTCTHTRGLRGRLLLTVRTRNMSCAKISNHPLCSPLHLGSARSVFAARSYFGTRFFRFDRKRALSLFFGPTRHFVPIILNDYIRVYIIYVLFYQTIEANVGFAGKQNATTKRGIIDSKIWFYVICV